MILKKWEDLPPEMQNDSVKKYYDILRQKRASLIIKRIFDIVVSMMMLIVLSPVFLLLAVLIKLDSDGPVFYRQVRVTSYNEDFRIFKFRTMVNDADKIGTLITVSDDARVTRIGKVLRKLRLDELSQLIDVFRGKMTFVGVRPEVRKYVEHYTPEMYATLLMPAGVTSLTSIRYKDENELLDVAENPDEVYINEILPDKMRYNLQGIEEFSFFGDIKIMLMTFLTMLGKEYPDN